MANITRADIAQFLEGMRAKFAEVQDQGKDSASRWDVVTLFESKPDLGPLVQRIAATGEQKKEFTFVTGAVGYLEPTAELEPFKETNYLPGYITAVQPYKFTNRISVSREAVEKRKPEYARALDEASKLLETATRTLSMHTWDLFNNLRTAPASLPNHLFAYNDGVKIASVAHPLVNSGTVSNVLASSPALSVDALELAYILGYNTKDDTGKPMPYFAGQKYLVVSPSLVRKAREIALTENTPYTSNFVANIFRGSYDVVMSPYITSTTQWTLVDGMATPIRQVVFKDITTESWFDDNVKAFKYDVSAEWRIGTVDFRGIVHSVGDSTTITD
jgi:hypothetical protein